MTAVEQDEGLEVIEAMEEQFPDEGIHGFCDYCYPGVPFRIMPEFLIAVCGARVHCSQVPHLEGDPKVPPPGACKACVEVILSGALCPRCGKKP